MAAASPTSSLPPMSDADLPPSSPRAHLEKSFMTNVTEDDDSKMASATPEPTTEKHASRSGAKKRAARESAADLGGGAGSQIGKIKHLKFEDGRPLMRKDIQYDFLRAIFDNEQKVFTNSYEPDHIPKQCFADLYIDTMSRSSKTSKVLRDKLLSDREAAKGMAMVCLLVNIGRMNTTLNFFPEMRAQLRTYHAIPSLQLNQDSQAYKQLQDAPRLKSILKGAAEDRDKEPTTLDMLKAEGPPRTNPVNLLFILCNNAPKVAELHFPPGREFHDLVMKTDLSSESRAMAFLWIMWFYLESDFTEEGCEENPFGAGVDYGLGVANQGVPRLVSISAEREARENMDTPEEIQFGEEKFKLRRKIIEADQQFMADTQSKRGPRPRAPEGSEEAGSVSGPGAGHGPTLGILPRIRPSKHESDLDSIRSTPPPRSLVGRQGGGGLGGSSRRGPGLKYQVFEASSPAGGQTMESLVARKPRPPTAHQLAVERNRSQRVEYILDRGVRKSHHRSRKRRRVEGSVIRALHRLAAVENHFEDSEVEDESISNNGRYAPGANGEPDGFPFRERGFGGLCQLKAEQDDFGEECFTFSAALRRAHRRLTRWENHDGELGVIAPVKRAKPNGLAQGDDYDGAMGDGEGEGTPFKDAVDPAETEDEAELLMHRAPSSHHHHHHHRPSGLSAGAAPRNGAGHHRHHRHDMDANGDVAMDDGEDLDEVDKELLGLAEGDDADANPEEELDDVDKTLLGMEGDDSDTD